MGYEVPLSGITADNAYEKNLWCIQRISKGIGAILCGTTPLICFSVLNSLGIS